MMNTGQSIRERSGLKYVILVLTAALLLFLAGCDGSQGNSNRYRLMSRSENKLAPAGAPSSPTGGANGTQGTTESQTVR